MEKLRKYKKLWIALIICVVLLLLGVVFIQMCTITKVKVTGNKHYTKKEIKELVMSSRMDYNSVYFYWRVQRKGITDIPFIDNVEVSILDRHTVKIKVYEKDIIGYVKHLGYHLYFDKDGVVVEATSKKLDNIPQVKGIHFDSVKLYEKLPVEKEDVFKKILNLTKLLDKYEIEPDGIYFAKDLSVTLNFDQANVMLGKDVEDDEKFVELKQLLPDLEGMKGTLHMENYDEDMKNITFKKSE